MNDSCQVKEKVEPEAFIWLLGKAITLRAQGCYKHIREVLQFHFVMGEMKRAISKRNRFQKVF